MIIIIISSSGSGSNIIIVDICIQLKRFSGDVYVPYLNMFLICLLKYIWIHMNTKAGTECQHCSHCSYFKVEICQFHVQ